MSNTRYNGLEWPTTKAKQRLWVATIMSKAIDLKQARINELEGRIEAVVDMLDTLYKELHNRPPIGRAPASSQPMTPARRMAIRLDHAKNPEMSQMQLAQRNGVNSGRVSEELAGKRE